MNDEQTIESRIEWHLSQSTTIDQPVNPLDFWLAVECGEANESDTEALGWSINE